MATLAPKKQILSLYKVLLREAQKFPNYNFRCYALRRVKDAFKENKSLTDQHAIKKEIEFAKQNVDIIKRQVVIGALYRADKLVIENTR